MAPNKQNFYANLATQALVILGVCVGAGRGQKRMRRGPEERRGESGGREDEEKRRCTWVKVWRREEKARKRRE